MKHILKHGVNVPTVNDLDDGQLGICTSNDIMYTRVGNKVVALNDFSNEPLLPHEFRTVSASLFSEQQTSLGVTTKSGVRKTFVVTSARDSKTFNLRYNDDYQYKVYPILNNCSYNEYTHTFACNPAGIGQFIVFFSPEETYKVTVFFDSALSKIVVSIGYIDATIGND